MRAISAVDAVSPAIQRTREFLFHPFRWSTYLKLGLVAILTEGSGSNLSSPSHSSHQSDHLPQLPALADIPPVRIAEAAAALLLVFVLCCFLLYLITRLRFAFFHCLVHNIKQIRPGWHIYREQAWRFFLLNMGIGVCFLAVVALIAIPFVGGFLKLIRETPPGGSPDIGLLLTLVLPLIPIAFVLALACVAADIVLRDWMLPHYALENATAGQAWARVSAAIAREKGQFFLYAVLRLVLPVIATVALLVVLLIPGLMLGGAGAAIEYALHATFAGASGAAVAVGDVLQAFFALVGFAVFALLGICLGGPISTAVRQYALLFYGGRYPALAAVLSPLPQPLTGPAPQTA